MEQSALAFLLLKMLIIWIQCNHPITSVIIFDMFWRREQKILHLITAAEQKATEFSQFCKKVQLNK